MKMCVCLLAVLKGSLRAPPLQSNCSLHGAQALLFRAVIGQGPPVELVCSSFVAPRFHSLLKASLWQDETSAASPSSFTLPRLHTQTHGSVHRLPRPCYHNLWLRGEKNKEGELGTRTETASSSMTCLMEFVELCVWDSQQLAQSVYLHHPSYDFRVTERRMCPEKTGMLSI